MYQDFLYCALIIHSTEKMRYLIIAICVAVIIAYLLYKWKRASKYVEGRNEIYSEYRKKQRAYAQRCKEDNRWPEFKQKLEDSYMLTEDASENPEAYILHDLNIADVQGAKFEPNSEGSESVSLYAYLKRKSKPKYLQVEYTADKQIVERKISGMQWYDLFEKSV